MITITGLLLLMAKCLQGYTFEDPYLLTAFRYHSVQVECTVNGTVDGTTDWKYQTDKKYKSSFIIMRDIVQPQYAPKFEVDVMTHALTIHNATIENSGLYTCVDSDGFGTSYYTQLAVVEEYAAMTAFTPVEGDSQSRVVIAVIVAATLITLSLIFSCFIVGLVYTRRRKRMEDMVKVTNIHSEDVGSGLIVCDSGTDGNNSKFSPKAHRKLPPVHFRVLAGNVDELRMLNEAGTHVNAPDKILQSALFPACIEGHHLDVTSPKNKDADVSLTANGVSSPLAVAAWNGQAVVVEELLHDKADVNSSDDDGFTPLHSACRNGHLDVVELLLQHGAAVDRPNKMGFTPLSVAAVCGHVDVVKHLIHCGGAIDETTIDGTTALGYAALYGRSDVVYMLVENGASVNSADNNGFTPLHCATQNNHLDVVEYLTYKGADINTTQIGGATPLFVAAARGHLEIAQFLIDHGADIGLATHNGETPISAASLNGHIEMVKVLIYKNANVNLPDHEGFTPLYNASQNGHIDIVKLLIASGAVIDLPNKNNSSPISVAIMNGHHDIVKYLSQKGENVNQKSLLVVSKKDVCELVVNIK